MSTAQPDVLDVINPPRNKRLLAFRILAALPIILFSVNATNLLAPWTFILTPDDKLAEPHRWFFVVSAAADLLLMASFIGLVVKPRLTVLAAWIPVSLVIVLVTIVPLQPEFLILVAIVVLPATIAYPYWRDLRAWRDWWDGVRPELMAFAAVVAAAMLVVAVIAFRRQVIRDDSVTDANWWNDDAEHTADFALAGLLAISRGPGALILRAVLSAIWVYTGIIAAFVLPDAIGSVGRVGGTVGIAIGLVFAWSTWSDWDATHRPKQRAVSPAVPQQRVS